MKKYKDHEERQKLKIANSTRYDSLESQHDDRHQHANKWFSRPSYYQTFKGRGNDNKD